MRDECVIDLVVPVADPARTAIVTVDDELTYAQLDEEVRRAATGLRAHGIGPGDCVAILVERSVDQVTTFLAALALGAVTVPVDPDYPSSRIAQVWESVSPRLIVRSGGRAGHDDQPLSADSATTVDALRENAPLDVPLDDAAFWRPGLKPDDTAIILFTSGSTGQPKGVRLSHAGIVNRLRWGQRYYSLEPSDRVLHKASVTFDASLHEILSPLVAGGTLVIAPPGLQMDSRGLVHLIRDLEVTTAHFVPSLLRHVLDEDDLVECTSLRRVLCGGEPLDMDLVRRWAATLDCPMFNQYGPTETSISVTCWPCDPAHPATVAPLGYAIDGAWLHVVDERMVPVGPGEVGELWIGGTGVANGYLNDTLTHERFRPNPFVTEHGTIYRTGDLVRAGKNGLLEFRGRADDQVKIHGVRVEPAEVAAVLRRHPAVTDAAVVAQRDDEGVRLVAYVQARRERAPVVDGHARVALRQDLAVATPSPDETRFLHQQVFEENEYGRHGVTVPDGGIVLDVGANIGLFSLWARRQARDVRVVAVEPNPDVLPYLRLNLDLEGSRADVVAAAIADRRAETEFTSFPALTYLSGLGAQRDREAAALLDSYYGHSGPGADGVTESERTQLRRAAGDRLAARSHTVRTLGISDVIDDMALPRVDVLKINIEGAELTAVRSIRPEHWPLIGQVAMEVERWASTGEPIVAILRQAGFKVEAELDWSVGPEADVAYVYAVREVPPGPSTVTPVDISDTSVLSDADVRSFAAEWLPVPMRPTQVVFLEDLPRLPNGKIALAELPTPPTRPTAGGALDGPPEELLRDLWRSVLRVDHVLDDDDFVSLGGHSLHALRVAVAARTQLGLEIAPVDCVRAPSFGAWRDRVLATPAQPVARDGLSPTSP